MEGSQRASQQPVCPFWCTICSEGFATVQLLSRHAHRHANKRKRNKPHNEISIDRTRVSQACKACATSKVKCDNDSEICRRCRKKRIPCMRTDGCELDTLVSCARVTTPVDSTVTSSDSRTQVIQSSWSLEADAPETAEHEVLGLTCSSTVDGFTVDTFFNNDSTLFYDFSDLQDSWERNLSTSQDESALGEAPPINSSALERLLPGKMINAESEATPSEDFRNSWGTWHPGDGDYQIAEQSNLVLPPNALQQKLDNLGTYDPIVYSEQIGPTKRDGILEMIYRTCQLEMGNSILSPFPPEYFLNRLVGIFFTSHAAQYDTWIHIPTFKPGQALTELLVASIAAGGSLSTTCAVQAFGFALQETVAIRLPQVLRKANICARNLSYVQALALNLHTGLWSGNKRKMEIAGGFIGNLMNMLRCGNRFRRAAYNEVCPLPQDEGHTLDVKWRQWIEEQSFIRLVYHGYIHCMKQTLIKFMGSPVSTREMTLPLPQSRRLWFAKTAVEWKQIYQELQSPDNLRTPSLVCCLGDLSRVELLPKVFDKVLARMVTLYGISRMIFEQRLCIVPSSLQETQSMIWDEYSYGMISRMIQELRQGYEINSYDVRHCLTLEFVSMHHSSYIEQVELFAGKEGEHEARIAHGILLRWSKTKDARQAVWHAGQVIHAFLNLPPENLTEFDAVMLFHAALCIWIYGILQRSSQNRPPQPARSNDRTLQHVILDEEESLESQQWVSLGRGFPSIRAVSSPHKYCTGTCSSSTSLIPLDRPSETVQTTLQGLTRQFLKKDGSLPHFVQCIERAMDALSQIRPPFSR